MCLCGVMLRPVAHFRCATTLRPCPSPPTRPHLARRSPAPWCHFAPVGGASSMSSAPSSDADSLSAVMTPGEPGSSSRPTRRSHRSVSGRPTSTAAARSSTSGSRWSDTRAASCGSSMTVALSTTTTPVAARADPFRSRSPAHTARAPDPSGRPDCLGRADRQLGSHRPLPGQPPTLPLPAAGTVLRRVPGQDQHAR